MKKTIKTNKFLLFSLIAVCIICIIIFAYLIKSTNKKNTEMVGEIGALYMEEMNQRISKHFETIFGLRISGIEEIITLYPPESLKDYDEVHKKLFENAQIWEFSYLALASGDRLETIYGADTALDRPENFRDAVFDGRQIVTTGVDVNDNAVLLIGIPANYIMKNGEKSDALVAGLPVELIEQVLPSNGDGTLIFSHVIRSNGDFVIRGVDPIYDNYFDRVQDIALEYQGKDSNGYVEQMKNAIETDSTYSTYYQTTVTAGHLYFSPLPYTHWYLVTIMPYGELDKAISELNNVWILQIIAACCIILLAIALVSIQYMRINRRQLNDLEKARSEAINATKAKSEFLSNMSHDIRTPMNAIVGMTTIAISNIDNTQQVQNCLNKISLSSRHLLGLINDILDMSKIESGKMTLNVEQISLREIMDSIVSIVQPQMKAKDLHFDVFIKDVEYENICCDSVRLNQVLINLLSNAMKFTPVGGHISVLLYEETSPKGDSYTRTHLNVVDDGIGMSAEFKEKVFETFVREDKLRVHKTEGTGLGMAITKYIVDAMGGTIEVESEQGKGTEFHVVLDLEKATVTEDEMKLANRRMLVVDDDSMLCQSAVASLGDIGIEADSAPDGETALKMINERHKSGESYEIVLLDWKLSGIDGIETARRIRTQIGENMPILLISAYDWTEIENEAREAGITGFLSKPLFRSTLYYGLRPFYDSESDSNDKPEESSYDFSGKRVLLAEDNDLNWEIAEALLSGLGITLDHAENGKRCAEMFEGSAERYYDAILMDIRMPIMTGYEAAEAIRAMDRADNDIPIIAMTADAFAEDVKKCLDCGMNAHVAKPIDINEVAKILSKYINKGE